MNRSENVKELVTALSSFQGQLTAVKKDAINPFFKSRYATLDTIWDTIRKPLAENGLSISQTMDILGIEPPFSVLETTLYHTSGEWINGRLILNPVKDDPQGLGSAITYARRYSLCAMLGVVADEDDDATVISKPTGQYDAKSTVESAPTAVKKTTKKYDTSTLEGALEFLEDKNPNKWGHTIVATRIIDKYGITGDSIKELVAKLSPEQKEELVNIISNEVIKLNTDLNARAIGKHLWQKPELSGHPTLSG